MDIIGQIFPQNCGDSLIVLEKTNKKQGIHYLYKCQFLKYSCEVLARKDSIKYGIIVNYNKPIILNLGFLGIGKYNYKNNKNIYRIWYNLLTRCYNKNHSHYKFYGAKGVEVCNEWLNFQNFAAWYEEQSKWNTNNYKLELDKDILCNIFHLETKIYSPDTCLLIPSELNSYLAGDNLNCGILNRDNKYQVKISRNKKQIYLGTYFTFKEAKIKYAKKKYEFWLEEINKYNLPNKLKEIFLKYKFYIN